MMSAPSKPRLTILIKALNEEHHIAACLDAAVPEAQAFGGEIILIDSLSTDNTVVIARQYPIRIIQFERIEDRGCGAAVQLGYQYARGDFIYVLDADMELQPGFIAHALEYLETNPAVAGVGGLIIDTRKITPEDRRRAEHYSSINDAVFVDHLGGGGLFRRSAIASVDYLSNRWLKACEEGDLGMRLVAAGWHLVRLPVSAVKHTGHNESGLEMMFRLWRNGRMQAYGVFLRNAIGRPWWWASIKHAWFIFAAPALYLIAFLFSWVQTSAGIEPHKALLTSVTLLWILAFLALWKKKRDAADALLAIAAWHFYAVAAIPTFLKKVPDPHQLISARKIK
ncbi:glycosyltransferase [Methylobacter sp. G7]|uniref:glycosyltransferase family 2 protein n=1 Tax=Methylobacter sp. G7 TaxID=3230117 RepID=UPI003D806E24